MTNGDLNENLISAILIDVRDTYKLENHVTYATHLHCSLLNQGIKDFAAGHVMRKFDGSVRSSDHFAVLTTIQT